VSSRSRIAALVVLALVGAAAFFGVRSYLSRGVVAVQTGRVQRQKLVQVVTASGEITPTTYANIGAEQMGRITEIFVKEGDRVRAGQRLAQLETIQPAADVEAQRAGLQLLQSEAEAARATIASNDAALAAQQATLERAQAELERAELAFNRAAELLESGLVARDEYEQRRATFRAAEAAIREAEANVERLRQQRIELQARAEAADRRVAQAEAQLRRVSDVLRRYTAVTPIDGVVTNLPVRVGETVVPGIQNSPASLLMTIADMSVITAEVLVDETDVVSVRMGQEADVAVDALPELSLTGRVTEIGNTAILRTTGVAASQTAVASQEAKDFEVEITLENPPETLRPGMSTTARITTAVRNDVLTVPIQALTVRTVNEADEEGVFLVNGGLAVFQPVRTGVTGASAVEVISGLNEGDLIVTGSYQTLRTLRSGAEVRVENESER